jgi:hypothetical protein
MNKARLLPALISLMSSPLLMLILGAAITLALIYGGEPDGGLKSGSARAGRATVSDDGDAVQVTVRVKTDDPSTHVVVRDEDGKELFLFNLFRDRHFNVESAPMAPVRFDVIRFASSAVSVYAGKTNGPVAFSLDLKPEVPSEVVVDDTARMSKYGVRVTAKDEVIPDEKARPLNPNGMVSGPP